MEDRNYSVVMFKFKIMTKIPRRTIHTLMMIVVEMADDVKSKYCIVDKVQGFNCRQSEGITRFCYVTGRKDNFCICLNFPQLKSI